MLRLWGVASGSGLEQITFFRREKWDRYSRKWENPDTKFRVFKNMTRYWMACNLLHCDIFLSLAGFGTDNTRVVLPILIAAVLFIWY